VAASRIKHLIRTIWLHAILQYDAKGLFFSLLKEAGGHASRFSTNIAAAP
jgi:hypothetical protein